MKKIFFGLIAFAALVSGAWGQSVTIIVPYGAGGTTDILARRVAQRASEMGAGTWVVENTPGSGGAVGQSKLMQSDPSRTLLISSPLMAPELLANLRQISEVADENLVLMSAMGESKPSIVAHSVGGTRLESVAEAIGRRLGVAAVPFRGSAQALEFSKKENGWTLVFGTSALFGIKLGHSIIAVANPQAPLPDAPGQYKSFAQLLGGAIPMAGLQYALYAHPSVSQNLVSTAQRIASDVAASNSAAPSNVTVTSYSGNAGRGDDPKARGRGARGG